MGKGLKHATMILALCLCALNAGAMAPRRRALVIGNDSYPGNELHNARNDARSVADALKLDGYQTTLALDVNRRAMTTGIDHFAQDTNPGDVVIFYYAGHGLQVGGENYLVPTDFVVTTPDDVKAQGVSLSSLLESLSTHGAATQVVILDACRNNPFLGTRSMRGGWASIGTSAGTFIAFGTSPGSTASDDPTQPHGLFTMSLLKYLSTSHLDIEQMFQQVRLDVVQQSHGEQIPWTASSLVGSFHILPDLDRRSPPVSAVLSPIPATEFLNSEFRSVDAPASSTPTSSISTNSITATSIVSNASEGMPRTQSASLQAVAAIQTGQIGNAISILQTALAKNPDSRTAARLLALALQRAGKSAEAATVLNGELSLYPNDADGLVDRCLIETDLDSTSSIQNCEAAVKLSPNSSDAHVALANALYAGGQVKRAYDEATSSIKLSPTQSVAFALRGRILASQGYSKTAQEDYERAVNLKLAEISPK